MTDGNSVCTESGLKKAGNKKAAFIKEAYS